MPTHTFFRTALIAAVAACAPCLAEEQETEQNKEIDIEKVSEAFGHFVGRNLKSPGINFDIESIITGIRNGAAGAPAPMSDQEYEMAMSQLQERAFNALSKENLDAANDFMAGNASDDDVVVIEEGKLHYTTLDQGEGDTVTEHGAPLIHYTGKYIDGTVFGCSEEVGGPITIPLDQTIPGFSKGLVGMKQGEKRRLFVHPDLGYGTLGNFPPNALLIFDVEIIEADTSKSAEPDDDVYSFADDEEIDLVAFSDEEESDDDEE